MKHDLLTVEVLPNGTRQALCRCTWTSRYTNEAEALDEYETHVQAEAYIARIEADEDGRDPYTGVAR